MLHVGQHTQIMLVQESNNIGIKSNNIGQHRGEMNITQTHTVSKACRFFGLLSKIEYYLLSPI